MRTVVLGDGLVGRALAKVLRGGHEVYLRDLDKPSGKRTQTEVLNICFPYAETFCDAVCGYIKSYRPELTIIHSTVPIGTTRAIAERTKAAVVHSPVNGRHCELERAMQTFTKIVGATKAHDASVAAQFLATAGMSVSVFPSCEDSEAAKLLCTLRYGLDIKLQKEVKAFCEERQLSFGHVYGLWTALYDCGYEGMGLDVFSRPIIEDMRGEIGGTCVIPNARMLPDFALAHELLEFNETLQESIQNSGQPCLTSK